MTTKQTVEGLEATVEGLEAELEELAAQVNGALLAKRRADERIAEIEEQRAALSPHSFRGDKKATAELEKLEDEHDQLARSSRVARAALPGLEQMLEEARERLAKARKDVHRDEAAELARQSAELDPERDELAARLHEVLEEQSRLYTARQQVVNLFDQDEANRMASAGGSKAAMRDYLTRRFGRWLS